MIGGIFIETIFVENRSAQMRLQELTWPVATAFHALMPSSQTCPQTGTVCICGIFSYQPFLFEQGVGDNFVVVHPLGLLIISYDLDPVHILCKMCLWLSLRLSLRL